MQFDYPTRVTNIVRVAAEAAKQDMVTNAAHARLEAMVLYVKPCTNTMDGMLRMFPKSATPPADWKPAGAEELAINVPYDSYFSWIHQRSSRLPILAPEF